MKKPSQQQLETAILWLESNEGDEAEDCAAVAAWISAQIDSAELDRTARRIAKETGRSVPEVRARLKQMDDSSPRPTQGTKR